MVRPHAASVALLCGLFVLLGCSDDVAGESVGGHTNWLPCEEIADCGGHREAVACTEGYCVDTAGARVRASSRSDAGPRQEGGGGSSGTSAGNGGRGGAAASGGGAAARGGAEAGAPSAGSGGDASTEDAAVSGVSDAGAAGAGGSPAIENARIPECPGMIQRCASERCQGAVDCVTCPADQLCLELELSCGPAAGSTAQCIDRPCGANPLDCTCASWVCNAVDPSGTFATCDVVLLGESPLRPGDPPFMMCTGGGPCAAPDTLIATPTGDVPIALLRPGDLVYSQHEAQVTAVPLLAVARTPVRNHRVVRLTLDDGSVLEVSARHPLADGRLLGALREGEELDGRVVVSAEIVDYPHEYTHDILPASDTGVYLAHGLWLGSTLR